MTHKIVDSDGLVTEILTIEEQDERAYRHKAAEGDLDFRVGRESHRNNQQDDEIKRESYRAQLVEYEIQEAAALNKVATDEAIQQESYRAQLVEDELVTQCGMGASRDDLQDTMFCKSVIYGSISAGTDTEKPVFVAPNACRLTDLTLINSAALAIDGTDNTKLELINKGFDGTGTTVLATFDNATEAFVAFDAVIKSISGQVDLAAGDVLTLKKTDTGVGAATDELFVAVSYSPIP